MRRSRFPIAPEDKREASDPFLKPLHHGVAFLLPGWSSAYVPLPLLARPWSLVVPRYHPIAPPVLHKSVTCQPATFAVVSKVPIKRLKRSPRLGESRLAAEQETSPDGPFPFQTRAAVAHRERASPAKSAGRAVLIQKTGKARMGTRTSGNRIFQRV